MTEEFAKDLERNVSERPRKYRASQLALILASVLKESRVSRRRSGT